MADGLGFESAFMHFWRIREQLLDVFEKTTGGRVIFSVCKVGGIRHDLDDQMIAESIAALTNIRGELTVLRDTFLYDSSVHDRLSGSVCCQSRTRSIWALPGHGPRLRVSFDARMDGHGIYDQLGFEPIVRLLRLLGAHSGADAGGYQSIDMSIKGSKRCRTAPLGPRQGPAQGRVHRSYRAAAW